MKTRTSALRNATLLAATALFGCSSSQAPTGTTTPPGSGAIIAMDFTAKSGFYGLPFPNDARLLTTGKVDMSAFPNPNSNNLVIRVLDILAKDGVGFGTTSGAFFQLDGPIAADRLPDVHASVQPGSAIVLLDIDPTSPDRLKRHPISSAFLADGGPFGAPNLLAVLPLQGMPLAPKRRYAVAVMRALQDAKQRTLGRSQAMVDLAAGKRPEGMSDAVFATHGLALKAFADAGIAVDGLAAITAFTTGAPTDGMTTVTHAMLAAPLPAPLSPFKRNESFPDFCVYETTIEMPEYQAGKPPYTSDGGQWVFDAAGAPVLDRMEKANFVVTIPKTKMPEGGYPIVVFSRTGGGGERPLVDRGVQAVTGGPAVTPGTGPALYLAKAGFAGSSIDGPHGGLRNVTNGDEQFLVFNVGNPIALRDNVRQSGAELALQAHVLDAVTIDVSDCAGAVAPGGKARLDPKTMVLMGHSMGAAIAPLTLAVEPRFRAALFSGAGGSFIENLIFKLHPIATKPLAEALLGLGGTGYDLNEHDPLLSMLQWAGEPADVPPYGDRVRKAAGAGPHILMMQGIVDSYILPPIANATSLSFGLDLAGQELDGTNPALTEFAPLGGLLGLNGRSVVTLPVGGNVATGGTGLTAVVTQHPEDGIENGHEVMFQTEPPKHEYRCFLVGLLQGKPRVPSPGKAFDPCD